MSTPNSPITTHATVAQRQRQRAQNASSVGSNPTRGTGATAPLCSSTMTDRTKTRRRSQATRWTKPIPNCDRKFGAFGFSYVLGRRQSWKPNRAGPELVLKTMCTDRCGGRDLRLPPVLRDHLVHVSPVAAGPARHVNRSRPGRVRDEQDGRPTHSCLKGGSAVLQDNATLAQSVAATASNPVQSRFESGEWHYANVAQRQRQRTEAPYRWWFESTHWHWVARPDMAA